MTRTAWKMLLTVITIAGLALAVLFALRAVVPNIEDEHGHGVEVGSILQDFTLIRRDHTQVPFSSVAGKVTLVNFWASWCEACKVEIPSINALRSSMKEQGLEVISINVDETPEKLLPKLLPRLKIDYPVYVDEGGGLVELFDIRAIPFSMVLDRDRKVLFIENGERDWNSRESRERITQWLSQGT